MPVLMCHLSKEFGFAQRMQLADFPRHECLCLPVVIVLVVLDRQGIGTGKRAIQNAAVIEILGQNLQHGTRLWPAGHRFPKARRATTVTQVIAVVKRPDTKAGNIQDLAAKNTEAAADKQIDIVGSDLLDIVFEKVIRPFTASCFDLDGGYIRQQLFGTHCSFSIREMGAALYQAGVEFLKQFAYCQIPNTATIVGNFG